jgi:ankyrin repeat protein
MSLPQERRVLGPLFQRRDDSAARGNQRKDPFDDELLAGQRREWERRLLGQWTQGAGVLHQLEKLDGTPLHFAVQGGNPALVRMLLAKGAEANARTTHAGLAPLHYVANPKLSPDVAKSLAEMLLEGGAQIDALGTDGGQLPGWTPLHIAVYHKFPQLAQLLLEKGADPNLPLTTQSGNERTVLNMAISGGATEMVDLLLKHKADVNGRDHNGDTPLVRAMRERNQQVAELLLTKGADPNALDAHGFPPLHVALGAQPPAQPGPASIQSLVP